MNKLVIVALAVMVMVGATQATQSYGIVGAGYVSPYSLDANPDISHSGWYSCYAMTQADAKKAMNTTETVTYDAMATWLGNNFAVNKSSVIENAQNISFKGYDSAKKEYSFSENGEFNSSAQNGIGVFFYADDSDNLAYLVINNSSRNGFEFDAMSSTAASSGWVPVSVPEPTSAMLLLFGFAGLALKRKRQ